MRRKLLAYLAMLALVASVAGPVSAQLAPGTTAAAPAAAPGAPISPTDSTKVPHYFGPYANWANSPQVLADATVAFTGGGGSGAAATATVNPTTGAISALTITSPGSGYTSPPTVAISPTVAVPTTVATATAAISVGVVNSITVAEPGFGFTAPSVAITGGGTIGVQAVALASGGVDDVTLVNGGAGYTVPGNPIVEFGLPNLPLGVRATADATMDASGVVTGVVVTNPGSGYTSAPTVTIWDAVIGQAAPTPATATSTIGIGQIDVTTGGTGYDSVPLVTITDVGGVDRGASATATVAALGAVSGLTITNPGAGYLTPGLKKFIDPLPGLCDPSVVGSCPAPGSVVKAIPLGVADTATYAGTDYYEIAVVQYRMKFSSQLPATLLRGYVQLETPANAAISQHVALTNATLDPLGTPTPIMLNGQPVYGVTEPHYLGPTIIALKDKPTRILFRNLLPTGVAGNLFLPVDTSLMGSGMGPDMVTLDANNVPLDSAVDAGTVMDGVRNPLCGTVPKPDGCYTENRATLHLHGGITPWISDGTPHQWITPAPWSGAGSATYPTGVSVKNVPDMPDPGEGAQTFFYTNQQSARLMFYHDHAWGITRLNVYAGEAAGYVVTDAMEQALIAPGGVLAGLGVGTPLVIQDKTFVSDNILAQDPTWDATRWGGTGNLWVAHVYMPAQNPSDPSGMSGFGRWMYGPWFWPPAKDAKYPPIANPYYDPLCDPNVAAFCEPALIPSTPNISVGMEQFNDTPVVNGTAYPTTTVDPKAYRYRVLNAANDRFWNLSWYVADPSTGTLSEVALNPTELAAAQTDPVVFPTPNEALSPKGPNWIQIGTEGGFLATPVVVPASPTVWITDPTRFDVGNVDHGSLILAPAERADVIVDFSQFRGKTLILYNDAPAAFPARVPGYDYYTGGPDMSPAGAPTTLPGYGPNTRTIMQVKVSTAAPATAWDRPNTTADRLGALMTAWAHNGTPTGTNTGTNTGVFESSMDPIIVGQAAYNTAYGTNFVASGWCNSPSNPSARCDGFARIAEGSQPTDTFGFNTLLGPSTKMQIPFQPKGIHDEMNSASFDEWGRMTANMGLEAPGATPLLQNIILYPYVNPATEVLDATGLPSSLDVTPIASAADGTQIWKITHNGVDTHPLHFHLYDVQVINRVTWDNIIIPPDPSEVGWKDTVRVSPLEDTIVAVRPIVPTLPFGILDSKRVPNPAMPLHATGTAAGTEAGFSNIGPDGIALITPVANEILNFAWEYVWHCHILSHEEMDMMRPVTVFVARALPDAPVLSRTGTGPVALTWTDGTPVNMLNPLTWGGPKSEVGYRIERATVTAGVVGAYSQIANGIANSVAFTDSTASPANGYAYRVIAYNAAGDSVSNSVYTVKFASATALARTSGTNPSAQGAPVTFTATVTGAVGTPTGNVQFTVDGVNAGAAVPLNGSGQAAFTTSTLTVGTHLIKALYAGSGIYLSSQSPNVSHSVSLPFSTTALARTTGPNPSVFGQSVTWTATVTGAVGTPTGNVQFTVDGVNAGAAVPLAGGVATFTSTTLTVGTHNIRAVYAGSASYAGSQSPNVSQTVNRAATTTTLVRTTGPNPSVFGQSVTWTATVAAVAPGAGTPTGSVQFTVNGVNAGAPVPLAGGVAAFTSTTLAVGTRTIRAIYATSTSFSSSQSPNVSQTVNRAATTAALVRTTGPNPSVFGQSVTWTATVAAVAPGAGIPTGSVQFTVDGVNAGAAVPLAGGVATFTSATLTVGTHIIRALYAESTSFSGSNSPNVSQIVNRASTTTALVRTSGANPSPFGASLTFTATVAVVAPGAGTPTGTVQFTVDGVNVGGPVTLTGGVAALTTTTLAVGTHFVRAIYATSTNFNSSQSPNVSQVIN